MQEHRDVGPLTQFEGKILTVGAQLQIEGTPWWEAFQNMLEMVERGYEKELPSMGTMLRFLMRLEQRGMVISKWDEEKPFPRPRLHQVTGEGQKARSTVLIESPSPAVPEGIPEAEAS